MKQSRDRGFTLPETLVAIGIVGTLVTIIALTIVTSLRVTPDVRERADSAVAVQGITTFLPPDVDSTEPDGFDTAPSTASGCAGTDEGINLIHMTWSEEFYGNITNYVANYRYIVDGDAGRIQRVACSGQFVLGSPKVLSMSSRLSSTTPTVTLYDSDGDGEDDQVKVAIETLSGESVFIDAASKNPAETLPPANTNPATTTTTTTTTTIANAAPTALPTTWVINPGVASSVTLDATDADGTVASSSITGAPAGWTITTAGTAVTITSPGPGGTYSMSYSVTDDDGATSTANLEVTVSVSATTTTTTTTTAAPTTTTTTTLAPCVVSNISVSPNPVEQKFNSSPSKLKDDVDIVVTVDSGYCVGLSLQYDTGAPNGQYVQNLGDAPPYDVTLFGHPHGTELWATGSHLLQVVDGFGNVLDSTTLTVNPK